MRFQVAESYKRRDRRRLLLLALMFALLVMWAAWVLVDSASLSHKALAGLALVLLLRPLLGAHKAIRTHGDSFPSVTIIEADGKIEVAHRGQVVRVALSDIEGLRVQHIRGRISSLLVETRSMGRLRLEGYENLEQMAELLKRYTPLGGVTQAGFFHH